MTAAAPLSPCLTLRYPCIVLPKYVHAGEAESEEDEWEEGSASELTEASLRRLEATPEFRALLKVGVAFAILISLPVLLDCLPACMNE